MGVRGGASMRMGAAPPSSAPKSLLAVSGRSEGQLATARFEGPCGSVPARDRPAVPAPMRAAAFAALVTAVVGELSDRELALRERELDLRERELELRERELRATTVQHAGTGGAAAPSSTPPTALPRMASFGVAIN